MNKNISVSIKYVMLLNIITFISIFSSNNNFDAAKILEGLLHANLNHHKNLIQKYLNNKNIYSNEDKDKDIDALKEIITETISIKDYYTQNWEILNENQKKETVGIATPLGLLHGFVKTILEKHNK